MPRRFACLVMLLMSLPLGATQPREEAFPRPPELEPAVRFWTRVYSEWDTRVGVLHDARQLDVIYSVIPLSDLSAAERSRAIGTAIHEHRAAIKRLVTGKKKKLSELEKRIQSAWRAKYGNKVPQSAIKDLRFQRGAADRFKAGLVRSGAYKPYIVAILREQGLPDELAALPHVESSFHAQARSHVGAAGMWQFMPATGKRFMRVDEVVDERLDPLSASVGAAKLLKFNHEMLGTWPLALTAYNHGAAGMQLATERMKTTDIGKIALRYRGPRFGFDSRNFYAAFLAALNAEAKLTEVETHSIEQIYAERLPANFYAKSLAKGLGVDLQALKTLNPALGALVWQGRRPVPAGYRLYLPAEKRAADIPKRLAYLARTAGLTGGGLYQVQPGDTLAMIARNHRISIVDLIALNGLDDPNQLVVGQKLRLPGSTADTQSAVAEWQALAVPEPVDLDAESAARELAEAVDTGPKILPPQPLDGFETASLLPNEEAYEIDWDGTIRVLPGESLFDMATWLDLPSELLVKINELEQPLVEPDQTIRLAFGEILPGEFMRQRQAHHQQLHDDFFADHTLTGLCDYPASPGESLASIAARPFGLPVWLLQHFNPEQGQYEALNSGEIVKIPFVENIDEDRSPTYSQQLGGCPAIDFEQVAAMKDPAMTMR